MNHWKILEIEPESDLKAIKKAYAKKLKLTKPDEDPIGFQALHEAYKLAIKYAKQNAKRYPAYIEDEPDRSAAHTGNNTVGIETQVSFVDLEEESRSDFGKHIDEETIIQTPFLDEQLFDRQPPEHLNPDDKDSDKQEIGYEHISASTINFDLQTNEDQPQDMLTEHDNRQTGISASDEQALVENVIEHLKRKSNINLLQAWDQILDSPLLYDLRFKAWFTLKLFELIAEHQKSNYRYKLNRRTMLHLDALFLWSRQPERLEEYFDFSAIEAFQNSLRSPTEKFLFKYVCGRQHRGPMEYGNYYAKIGACIIDVALFLGVIYLGVTLNRNFPDLFTAPEETAVFLVLAWLFILFPLMEASPFQATPGKMILGLKVVDPQGKRLNIFHAIVRTLIFAASSIGFKITVWINLFINDGRLLHDKLSGSQVIKR